MGLKLPAAPDGTQQVVAYALRRAHSSGRFALSGTSGGGTAVVTPAASHQVFSIGLDQLAAGKGLKAVKMVGWRTMVLQGKNSMAAVEFTGGGADPKNFKSVSEGPHVQSTASAITIAENMPQVKDQDFELRLLQTPSIYLISLWLHGDKQELFVPLDPAPGEFKPYVAYSETDFFGLATSLAKRRLGFDDRPKGTPAASAPSASTPPSKRKGREIPPEALPPEAAGMR